jgi:hypothetical protein
MVGTKPETQGCALGLSQPSHNVTLSPHHLVIANPSPCHLHRFTGRPKGVVRY